jgi:nitroreductase
MEFQDVVRRRRMVRNFDDRPVPPEVRDRILSNALHAPSAGFSQGWAFMTFEGREETARFWDVTFPDHGPIEREKFKWNGMFNAPLIIVPFSSMDDYLDRYAEPDKGWTDRDPGRWPVPFWHIDTGMASMLMLQTVVDAGLGALFFGIFKVQEFNEAFAVPGTHTAIGAIAIGYPAPDEPSPSLKRGRRPLDDVVHRARWGAGKE